MEKDRCARGQVESGKRVSNSAHIISTIIPLDKVSHIVYAQDQLVRKIYFSHVRK